MSEDKQSGKIKKKINVHELFKAHAYYIFSNVDRECEFGKTIRDLYEHDGVQTIEAKMGDFLYQAINYISDQARSAKQQCFLLDIAICISTCEVVFEKLIENEVIQCLTCLSNPTALNTPVDVKIRFVKLLGSFLDHECGVEWMVENNYWLDVYTILVEYQHSTEQELLGVSYDLLTSLLEKTLEDHREFCDNFIRFLSKPLLLTIEEVSKTQFHHMPIALFDRRNCSNLNHSLTCLTEILERLFYKQNKDLLHIFLQYHLHEASDRLASISNEQVFSITLYRIVLLLSIFQLNDLFDGIKVINKDHLAISGLHRIIEREILKGNMLTLFEFFYYVLKYAKNEAVNLPKYVINGNLIELESEIIAFQLEGPIVIVNKLARPMLDASGENYQRDDYSAFITHNILHKCSERTLMIGYEFMKYIYGSTVDPFIHAIEVIVRSKNLYSVENIGLIITSFAFILENYFYYLNKESQYRIIKYEEHMYVETLLRGLLDFLETFQVSWSDSLKAFQLPKIIVNFLESVRWPSQIIVKSLKLMKLLIAKHMSPNMVLLIDNTKDTAFNDIALILSKKSCSKDWETRKAVVDVITAIAYSAHKSFSSFRDVLKNAKLPSMAAQLCLYDSNPFVKESAFKCLQEIMVMENVIELIPDPNLIHKVLDLLGYEQESTVQKEAIKFVEALYWNDNLVQEEYFCKMCRCMQDLAMIQKSVLVQKECIRFWRTVTKKHLNSVGWLDSGFPPFIFSKKIITMTDTEARKRITKTLNDLSTIGCLNIIKLVQKEDGDDVQELMEWIDMFFDIFLKYKIVPDMTDCQETIDPTCDLAVFDFDGDQIMENFLQDFPELGDVKVTLDNLWQGPSEVPNNITASEFIKKIFEIKTK